MTSMITAEKPGPPEGVVSIKSQECRQLTIDAARFALSQGMTTRDAGIVGRNRATKRSLVCAHDAMLETKLKPVLELSDITTIERQLEYDYQSIVALTKDNIIIADELDEIKIKLGLSEEEVKHSREERVGRLTDITNGVKAKDPTPRSAAT